MMTYSARILEIIIASPSDVASERQIVRDVLSEWNAVYSRERKVALMPLGWESHTSPELSGRPQQIINDRVLKHADILVGIFWTRVGSPTGKAISGSIEEIEEHLKQGKPVMLYFSNVPVALDSVDPDQYEQLKKFKAWARERGLVEFYDSPEDFREKFARQLPLALRDNSYLKQNLSIGATEQRGPGAIAGPPRGSTSVSPDALELLEAASIDDDGTIMMLRTLTGTQIGAGEKSFGDPGSRRSAARWAAAVRELHLAGLVRDLNGKGEVFEVTDAGYRAIEG